MGLYLVVAHQTASSPELLEQLQAIADEEDGAEFALLVPATTVSHLWTWIEGGELENARYRAAQAAASMRQAGLRVIDTVIGSADPVEAVRHELAQPDRSYHAVVMSTLPQGMSHWLRLDVPNKVRRKCSIKVISVISRGARQRSVSGVTTAVPPSEEKRSWEQFDLGEIAALRRSEVYCLDGKLGTLLQILYDYMTLEPVWLGIVSRPLSFRTFLVPAQASRLDAGKLMVPFKKEKIMNQPHIDIGEGIPSLTDEEHLYQYFGLTLDHMRELRVLHTRDELPGLEVNSQRIFENERLLH